VILGIGAALRLAFQRDPLPLAAPAQATEPADGQTSAAALALRRATDDRTEALLISRVVAGVTAVAEIAVGTDHEEKADPPVATRPLCSAITLAHARLDGVLADRPER
jgi:hypothetical protein